MSAQSASSHSIIWYDSPITSRSAGCAGSPKLSYSSSRPFGRWARGMGSAALVMVMRWVRRLRSVLRRWYRINARRLVRPDEHHRARSMVDDESSGMAQALRPESRTIAISGDDQDIHTLGNCAHHFLLDATTPAEPLC